MIGLKEFEVLAPQGLVLPAELGELLVHKPRLQLREHLDLDHPEEPALLVDQHDVLLEFVATSQERSLENLSHGRSARDKKGPGNHRGLDGILAEDREAEARAHHEAHLAARAQSDDAAGAHHGEVLHRGRAESLLDLLKPGVGFDRLAVVNKRFQAYRGGSELGRICRRELLGRRRHSRRRAAGQRGLWQIVHSK